jgi:hypothetical protein
MKRFLKDVCLYRVAYFSSVLNLTIEFYILKKPHFFPKTSELNWKCVVQSSLDLRRR